MTKLPLLSAKEFIKILKKLGFNKWFQDRTDPAKLADFKIARVITVNKNSYVINK